VGSGDSYEYAQRVVGWGHFTRNEHRNATLQKVRRLLTVVANQAKSPGYSAREYWYPVLLTPEELAIDMVDVHLPTTDQGACVA